MQGQTVYYRLSEENMFDIRHMREMKATVEVFDGVSQESFFHGASVNEGMMLPAQVIRCYSQYLYDRMMHPRTPSTRSKRYFSGFADIKVSLPGNDFLWVPMAEMDDNPKPFGEIGEYGSGLLVVPEIGKFTVVGPAPLV